MNAGRRPYFGRFAPSPTGPLHAGSLVAALASWLDARAHQGQWLIRIEDIDSPRCIAGASEYILHQLQACGLHPDLPVVYQSQRKHLYQAAYEHLITQKIAYRCACSRKEIEAYWLGQGHSRASHNAWIYPNTCRLGLQGRPARSTRIHTGTLQAPIQVEWQCRRLGQQHQNLTTEVGDFVIHRSDGLWAYQLAVVVDDAEQGITDVVRGADLTDNTPRQIYLQKLLGLTQVRYLHTPLVLAPDGEKLSKQNGAHPFDFNQPLKALKEAAIYLGIPVHASSRDEFLAQAIELWRLRWRQEE
jgi:glutamyl-Q tRNA(Asp) synthetase